MQRDEGGFKCGNGLVDGGNWCVSGHGREAVKILIRSEIRPQTSGGEVTTGMMSMTEGPKMKSMTSVLFKVRCLSVIETVRAKRESVLITEHGVPLAILVPANPIANDIFRFLGGKGHITGDVVSPVMSPEIWGELK